MTEGRPRWLVWAFALAMGLALIFSGDAVWRVTHLEEGHAPVEAWMSPAFLIRVYGVAPEALTAVTGDGPGATLEAIAEDRGMPTEALVAAVQALVAR